MIEDADLSNALAALTKQIKEIEHGRCVLTLEVHDNTITLARVLVEQDLKPQALKRFRVVRPSSSSCA